jgi:predicted Zn-dependent protease
MADVMRMLERVSDGSPVSVAGRVPSWLSSHPSPEARLARVRAREREFPDGDGRGPGRQAYLRHVDGVVYGPDPREGFVKDDTFYHPGLGFRLDLPKGFAVSNTKQMVSALSPRRDAVVVLAVAGRGTPESAARAFFSQPGIAEGREWRRDIHRQAAVAREFQAESGGTLIRGLTAFVEHQGRVLQLLGYTPASLWSRYDGDLADSLGSFRVLTDRRYLDVQPMRVEVVNVPRAVSVEEFARRQRAVVDAREVALLNGLGPEAELRPGQLAKTVVGDEMAVEITKELARYRE